MKKLRLGITLVIVSWLPIAQLLLWFAHNHGHWLSEKATETVRLVVWGVQIVIGLVGVWFAGEIAVQSVKKDGWKKAPRNLWVLLRTGQQ